MFHLLCEVKTFDKWYSHSCNFFLICHVVVTKEIYQCYFLIMDAVVEKPPRRPHICYQANWISQCDLSSQKKETKVFFKLYLIGMQCILRASVATSLRGGKWSFKTHWSHKICTLSWSFMGLAVCFLWLHMPFTVSVCFTKLFSESIFLQG